MMPFAIPFPPLSPEIFAIEIGGVTLALRWYALAYILGLVLGWRIVTGLVKRPALWGARPAPMSPPQVEALLTWVILGVVLGGRLGFVLFYQPDYYLRHPAEILMVWQGGMAFHGGLVGVVLAVAIFCWREGVPHLQAADALAVATPPGLLLGRMSNFINAELWGRPTDAPWGVIFPGVSAQNCGQPAGELCARHPSQLYEAGLEGLLLGLVLWWLVRRGALARTGTVFGTFLAGYGAARFVVELVRQPDAQFVSAGNPVGHALHFGGWGLTMGQILSLPMIALGLWLIARARRTAP
ncbi:prolipoprotein diacylglyceryl transferase [Dinoroseobacter shibae DFL 12 = DSM 16493]|uniref:Phosphatidylglycerol--prolipoprotein diacylglyceryl transferase n=2 Tax=Dinoroseobacter shibae TaxID=215813 RepID=A8LI48_DINSH|nr:prolipoprotein diacylglyceryl transferase [Dinoroseobacter shibae DFL 12 = DSM 16493]